MGNCSSNKDLLAADLSKVPKHSYNGRIFTARIAPEDCYDGYLYQ